VVKGGEFTEQTKFYSDCGRDYYSDIISHGAGESMVKWKVGDRIFFIDLVKNSSIPAMDRILHFELGCKLLAWSSYFVFILERANLCNMTLMGRRET